MWHRSRLEASGEQPEVGPPTQKVEDRSGPEAKSNPKDEVTINILNAGFITRGQPRTLTVRWGVLGSNLITLVVDGKEYPQTSIYGEEVIPLSTSKEAIDVVLRVEPRSGGEQVSKRLTVSIPSIQAQSPPAQETGADDIEDPLYQFALAAAQTDLEQLCVDNAESSSPDPLFNELRTLTLSQVDEVRNTICARHGTIFSPKWQPRFQGKSWYRPLTRDGKVIDRSFNELERKNVSFLLELTREIRKRTSEDALVGDFIGGAP